MNPIIQTESDSIFYGAAQLPFAFFIAKKGCLLLQCGSRSNKLASKGSAIAAIIRPKKKRR